MMRKLLVFFMLGAIMCSCASQLELPKTVWFNVVETEYNGEKVHLITTLYFIDDKIVDINKCLQKDKDTSFIVPPRIVAYGKYTSDGKKIKNGIDIKIDANTVDGKDAKYSGKIVPKGMVLVSNDTARVFNMVKNLTIK